MTLEEILKDVSEDTEAIKIVYRTIDPYGMDIFSGLCEYRKGELNALDGDSYSLLDEITRHEWKSFNELVVWYESEWIS